jgi:hypothetical protein
MSEPLQPPRYRPINLTPVREVTPLSSDDEYRFQLWAKANGISDIDDPRSLYDYRGYFKDVALRGVDQRKMYDDGLHFPDTYKQHGHPTFSVESKYSAGPADGGRWDGETYIPQQKPAPTLEDRLAIQPDATRVARRGVFQRKP